MLSLVALLRFTSQTHGRYIGLGFRWNWSKLQGQQYFVEELPFNRRARRICRMRLFMLHRRVHHFTLSA